MHSTPNRDGRRARRLATAGAVTLSGLLVAGAVGAGPASASSHREAPGVSATPKLDTTDVYAFQSPDKEGTVTLLANWVPFSEPAGGPNFYTFDDDAYYEILVDTDGDAKEDVTFRWDFKTKIRDGNTFLYNTGVVDSLDDPDLNVVQKYDLSVSHKGKWKVLKKDGVVAPSNVGKASMPDYAKLRRQAVYEEGDKAVFAGQADDPFFADLRVFDLLYGGNGSEVGNDTLAGYNVNTTAVRVPVKELGGEKNIIGVWSRAAKRDSYGKYRQVSRLGMPLVNEVVIPLNYKDRFNASEPKDDAQFLKFVTNPGLPKVIEQVLGAKAPAEPRKDLVQVFLTGVPGINQPYRVKPSEMLRLNLKPFKDQKYSTLGVIGGDKNGFPNGRRLKDDVIDISLQVVQGELVGTPNDLGDKVDRNDVDVEKRFPYIGLPTSGSYSVNSKGGGGKGYDNGKADYKDDAKKAEHDKAAKKAEQDKAAKGHENKADKAHAAKAGKAEAAAVDGTVAIDTVGYTAAESSSSGTETAGLAGLALLGGAGGTWMFMRRRRIQRSGFRG